MVNWLHTLGTGQARLPRCHDYTPYRIGSGRLSNRTSGSTGAMAVRRRHRRAPLIGGESPDGPGDLVGVRHEPFLEDVVVGDGRDVGAGPPHHRPIEVVERLLREDRRPRPIPPPRPSDGPPPERNAP